MVWEMVKQFWNKQFTPKYFKLYHERADVFTKCQWQSSKGVSAPYLLYRMVVALFFVAAFIVSILGIGRVQDQTEFGSKWPIYLTNWGFTMCTLQAVLALLIVSIAKIKGQQNSDSDADSLPLHYKIYWGIHTIASTGALCITISFWVAVYNPDLHPLDAVNLLTHAMNSIMMMIDLMIIAHSIRIAHIYLPLSFTLVYLIFSGFYYIAGGLDRLGHRYIYEILNWEKTGYAFLACFLGLIFVAVVHTILSLISTACRYLTRQLKKESVDEQIPC